MRVKPRLANEVDLIDRDAQVATSDKMRSVDDVGVAQRSCTRAVSDMAGERRHRREYTLMLVIRLPGSLATRTRSTVFVASLDMPSKVERGHHRT
jgi:hypothetical protein